MCNLQKNKLVSKLYSKLGFELRKKRKRAVSTKVAGTLRHHTIFKFMKLSLCSRYYYEEISQSVQ